MKSNIDPSFWTDPELEPLTPAERLAALWLITNPGRNEAGITQFSGRRFHFETGLVSDTIDSLLVKLPRFAIRIGQTIWVRNFIRYNAGFGHSLASNNFSRRIVSSIHECGNKEITARIFVEYPELMARTHHQPPSKPHTNPSAPAQTPWQPLGNPLATPSTPLAPSFGHSESPPPPPKAEKEEKAKQSQDKQSQDARVNPADTGPTTTADTSAVDSLPPEPRQAPTPFGMPGLGQAIEYFARHHPDIPGDLVATAWHTLEAHLDDAGRWINPVTRRPVGQPYSALHAEVHRLRDGAQRQATSQRMALSDSIRALVGLLESHPGDPKVNTDPTDQQRRDWREKTRELRRLRQQMAQAVPA